MPDSSSLNLTQIAQAPAFIFDVESIGLYGEAFAVAGGVYVPGQTGLIYLREFTFSCPPERARGRTEDREWVAANVPDLSPRCPTARSIRDAFWAQWTEARQQFPGIVMAADCSYPVETGFLVACIRDALDDRNWSGPYPLVDIGSILLASGRDPLAYYPRNEDECEAHHPLHDARQSARLYFEALADLVDQSAAAAANGPL